MFGDKNMANKFSIIIFSGTTDKLMAAGVLSQAATALGDEVKVFVTFWGLQSFTKGEKKMLLPKEFEHMGPMFMQSMKAHNVPSWYDMLKEAKELGAKVYACSMTCDLFGITREYLDPIVDDIVGAATFITESEGGQVLFI
jgi:peroxiredoxin family protein